MSFPLQGDKLLLFCVASCFHLFLFEYRVILEKERGKSRKGKKHQIRKRKKTHQIIGTRQSSRLRAFSPFRFSLSRESKKNLKNPSDLTDRCIQTPCHKPVSSQEKPYRGISTDQEVIWVYALIYSATCIFPGDIRYLLNK